MKNKIIVMLNEGKSYQLIFQILKCSNEQFLEALNEHQAPKKYTRVHHFENKVLAL